MTWFQKLHLSSRQPATESDYFIHESLIHCTRYLKGWGNREDADMVDEVEMNKQLEVRESGFILRSALYLFFGLQQKI